jgi:hypothetical protein
VFCAAAADELICRHGSAGRWGWHAAAFEFFSESCSGGRQQHSGRTFQGLLQPMSFFAGMAVLAGENLNF